MEDREGIVAPFVWSITYKEQWFKNNNSAKQGSEKSTNEV